MIYYPNAQVLIFHLQHRQMITLGAQMRTSVITALYKKGLLSDSRRISDDEDEESADITTLMSVDAQRFADTLIYIHICWTAPIQVNNIELFFFV